MRLKRNVNFRISDSQYLEIERLAEQMGVSHSEVWRRLLLTVHVLYSPDLTLSDVLRSNEETEKIHELLAQGYDLPLHEALKSIPELVEIIKAKETLAALEREKPRKKTP